MPVGAIIGAGALSAGGQIWGAMNAGDAQRDASAGAIAAMREMFAEAKNLNKPFIDAGKDAWSLLAPLLGMGDSAAQTDAYGNPVKSGYGALTNPFTPTQEWLENTPGFKFQQKVGTDAALNSGAARGLGDSPATLKAISDYNTGLASTTWDKQSSTYLNQNKQIYDMLFNPTQLGAGAAQSTASAAMGAGSGIVNALGYGGNAQAAMYNSIGSAVGNFGNSAAGALLYGSMLPQSASPGANNALDSAVWSGAGNSPTAFGPSWTNPDTAFGSGASPIPYLRYYQPFSNRP